MASEKVPKIVHDSWFQPLRKSNKYNNTKTYVGEIAFDSRAEANVYTYLAAKEKQGLIKDLLLQPVFPLYVVNPLGEAVQICKYICDFCYTVIETNKHKALDVKGVTTSVYRVKIKMAKALYPYIVFEEIAAGKIPTGL